MADDCIGERPQRERAGEELKHQRIDEPDLTTLQVVPADLTARAERERAVFHRKRTEGSVIHQEPESKCGTHERCGLEKRTIRETRRILSEDEHLPDLAGDRSVQFGRSLITTS